MVSPKSITAKRFFFICFFILVYTNVSGQAGKDGAKIVSALNTVVNDYTFLTADVSSGSSSIQVSNNNLSAGFSIPLSTGDLIFIIQVQGADINDVDDTTYGNIISYHNCGNNEFAEVASVTGSNIINVSCPLQYNYTASGKVVIVRVPRYLTLTINGGASLSCPTWNGSTGGILAIEVLGTTIINSGGSIDASAKGFRGGGEFDNNTAYGVLNTTFPVNDAGAEKGESIAGSVTEYDSLNGRYCKGAPANGGGGGNSHNAGGGGGSNAGNISNYTGFGNPDNTDPTWANAWNLEYAGFAASTSSGGGKGGYTFASSNQNALVIGPVNIAWGGDARRNSGGRGGHPLDYSSGKIFIGGGGGAGEQNDSKGGAGGNGGGIVMILSYATISGSGQILTNGANGFNTLTTNGTDGAGGAGGGGTVILNTTNAVSGFTVNAKGGNGGSQSVLIFTTESEGPGGGGGGGYIALSNGAVTTNTNGGINGTTNSYSLSEFPPNGATKGGAGTINTSLNAFRIIGQTVHLCSSSSATLTFTTQGNAPPGVVYSWYYQVTGGAPLATGATYTTPILTTSHTYYVSACPGNVRVPVQVIINNNISASFTSNVVCAGSATNFSATGSPNINSWSWDFGDGSGTSTQQNPAYIYSGGGTYTVTLTVSDSVCSSSVSQSVTVSNAPSVHFTSSANGGCGPLNVSFTNTTTGATSYSWNFGDGSPLNTQTNPSHAYAVPGIYTVVLTANGSGCSPTDTLMISVGPPPTASFSATNIVCQHDTVHFTNLSNGNGSVINSVSWNFGDGSPVSFLTNPNHIYSNSGTFNVTLTVATSLCTDDTIISISVNPAPVAHFTSLSDTGCAPLNVIFTNNTTGLPSYSWDFGDGSPTSSQANPSHVYYNPGTFCVTLVASTGGCSDTFSVLNLVDVYSIPIASFSSLTAICLGDSLSFTNLSNGNGWGITDNVWDFGDGTSTSVLTNPTHYFSSPGIYHVNLTTFTTYCSDDTTITVNVNPAPVVTFHTPDTAGCGSVVANFINATTGSPSYQWNFGDGSPASNQNNPAHTYSAPGIYSVTLIATQGSCADTLQLVNYIHVDNQLTSSFSATNACDGDSVHFSNLSNGNGSTITSYSWNFGDGNTGNSFSPSHLYSSPGVYNVQLTAGTANCFDDTTIAVTVIAAPVVNFTSNALSGCDSATIQFTNSSAGASNYSWSFGDGGTSFLVSPSHFYSAPGLYTVSLTATVGGACSATRTNLSMINIHDSPLAAFTASSTSICQNQCITFNSQPSAGATTWIWNFNGASPATSTTQNSGSICYSSTGNYDVSLQVSNGFCIGNHNETSYIHVVNCASRPSANFISSDTVLCGSACINYVDLSVNAISWQWFFQGASPTNSTLENPVNICYPNPGSYGVTLIASNPSGSDTIVYNNFIQVNSPPGIPLIAQSGDTLNSSPAFSYQWYFNNTLIPGATQQRYVAPLTGNYSVSIADSNGCSSTSSQLYVSRVGINDINNDLQFYIYPNPANDKFSILISGIIPLKLTVSLFDILGNKIFMDQVSMISNEETFTYNLKDLAAGIYFLQLQSDKHKWIRPLIRQ